MNRRELWSKGDLASYFSRYSGFKFAGIEHGTSFLQGQRQPTELFFFEKFFIGLFDSPFHETSRIVVKKGT